ncbi:hypothetical protein VP1G_05283 [Cytospora mali]|uniref:Uncharacterized protein n=1 Tax=Cytospora mali TaxID=578113 RepID=A0A194V288_CYTMA|nr:hypothetical protein VP1G_05283 [Valsa mali var. pyri (nom. inval.)]
MFSCCFTTRKYEDEAQSSAHGVPHSSPALIQDKSIREQAKSYIPSWQRDESVGSTTGLRKPSNAAKKRPVSTSAYRRKGEVRPTDYIYFGDGTSGGHVSNNSASKPQLQDGNLNGARSSQSRSEFASGKDNSGYTATGLNNNSQMGYSNLTYGGSLQFDFAETQAFGAGP